MKKVLLIFSVLVVLSGTLSALETGDTVPAFANMDLSGEFKFSKDYVGRDWLIIDFFATYCVPCKEEIPEIESLSMEFAGRPLTCMLIAADREGRAKVEPYFQKRPTSLTVLIDRYMVTAKRFGVESIPTVFLVDPDGRVVFKAVGYSRESIDEMHRILSEAFSN